MYKHWMQFFKVVSPTLLWAVLMHGVKDIFKVAM